MVGGSSPLGATIIQPTAIILGCGVSGLTCATRLLDAGFSVRILTKKLPPETTSSVAGAVWYPYRAYPQERVVQWAMQSLRRFEELASIPGSGISMIELHEFFAIPAADPWWRPAVGQFRRLGSDELAPGYVDGWAIRVARIETPVYLPYLLQRFQDSGGAIEIREVKSLEEVTRPDSLVINCTGLGARELCHDHDLFPIRGQVVSVENPGLTLAKVDEHDPRGVSYVIPRSRDCVLGSTATDHDWNLEERPEETRDIVSRCSDLEPRLRGSAILEVRVGLRPGRTAVRLEREILSNGAVVIHNYGHGGAGFTLSWGCAEEVLALC